jgi:hypothetical protein
VANHSHSKYFGIDHFGLESSAEIVRDMLASKELAGTIIEGHTHEVPWDKPLDLLLIDAGHDEANVKGDCEKYLPFVKRGGYVLFDDWDEPFDRDSAHWAVHFYGDLHTRDWDKITNEFGLEIRRRP